MRRADGARQRALAGVIAGQPLECPRLLHSSAQTTPVHETRALSDADRCVHNVLGIFHTDLGAASTQETTWDC